MNHSPHGREPRDHLCNQEQRNYDPKHPGHAKRTRLAKGRKAAFQAVNYQTAGDYRCKSLADVLGRQGHNPRRNPQFKGKEGVERSNGNACKDADYNRQPRSPTKLNRQVGKYDGAEHGVRSHGKVDFAGHQCKCLSKRQNADECAVAHDDLQILRCKKSRFIDAGVDAQYDQGDQDADLRRHQCLHQFKTFVFPFTGRLHAQHLQSP